MSLKDQLNNFIGSYQVGGRVEKYYEPSLPFAYLNPATVAEYPLQHKNELGVYNNVDLNDRLGWYEQYNPLLFKNNFQASNGVYGLQKGKSWLDSQKFFNTQVDDTVKMLSEKYGVDATQLQEYANNIKYVSDAKNTSRGLDNKGGEYTTSRPMFQVPLVTEEEKKQLAEKGIYTLRHIENNPEVAKGIIGDKVGTVLNNFVGNADAVIGVISPQTTNDAVTEEIVKGSKNTPTTEQLSDSRKEGAYNMPILQPDQRMPLEVGVDVGYLGRVEAPNFRKVNVSDQPQTSANYRQAMSALNQLKGAQGNVGNAMVASILGQTQANNNQAIGQVSAQNQNIDTQIERANEQAVATADQMNLELATNYNNQWLQGDANLDAINRSINKFNNEVAIENYKNQKMRRYVSDTLGVNVGDGMVIDERLNPILSKMYENEAIKQLFRIQNSAPQTKQKGGYIKEYIEGYFKK